MWWEARGGLKVGVAKAVLVLKLPVADACRQTGCGTAGGGAIEDATRPVKSSDDM